MTATEAAPRLFVPQTVTPPDAPLPPITALRTLVRNPIEAWHQPLFDMSHRELKWLGGRFFQIMDPELLQGIFRDHVASFRKSPFQQRAVRPALGEGLITAEGDHWRFQRRAASPAFRHDALTALVPAMAAAGEGAAKRLVSAARGGSVDVAPEMTRAAFQVIAKSLLGGDDPEFDQEVIARAITEYVESVGKIDFFDIFGVPGWVPRPWAAPGRRVVAAMRKTANEVIHKRRASGEDGDDLLGELLSARDPKTGNELSDIELRDNILTFVAAGHETTALTLTWALYLIANDHGVQERLVDEARAVAGDGPIEARHLDDLMFHAQVIKEAMRLYPPVSVLQRQAVEPVDIAGVQFAKGDEVVCLIYVMQRSRRLWERPEAFDPERFSPERSQDRHRFAFMPFGAGPRICIGLRFAEKEAAAILASLVRKVRFGFEAGTQVRPIIRVTTRPIGGMPLLVEARS